MVDATLSALERALDLRMRAHEVHVSNLANANVPDYKAKKIDFEDRLRTALEGVESPQEPLLRREGVAEQKLNRVSPDIYQDPLARPSGDGNTVNAEHEQTEIAKNTVAFEAAVQLINKKFALQKYVLGEAGR